MRQMSIMLTALCAALLMPHLGSTQTVKKGKQQGQLPLVASVTLSTLVRRALLRSTSSTIS